MITEGERDTGAIQRAITLLLLQIALLRAFTAADTLLRRLMAR